MMRMASSALMTYLTHAGMIVFGMFFHLLICLITMEIMINLFGFLHRNQIHVTNRTFARRIFHNPWMHGASIFYLFYNCLHKLFLKCKKIFDQGIISIPNSFLITRIIAIALCYPFFSFRRCPL